MFARVSIFEGQAEAIAKAAQAFDNRDELAAIPGIEDAYLLVDPQAGEAVTITLWETEEALKASAQKAGELRQDAAGQMAGQVKSVHVYEVAEHLHNGTR